MLAGVCSRVERPVEGYFMVADSVAAVAIILVCSRVRWASTQAESVVACDASEARDLRLGVYVVVLAWLLAAVRVLFQ